MNHAEDDPDLAEDQTLSVEDEAAALAAIAEDLARERALDQLHHERDDDQPW